jgi:FkbM family methyltransferase
MLLAKKVFGKSHGYVSWMREKHGTYAAVTSLLAAKLLHGGLARVPVPGGVIWVRPDTTDIIVVAEIFHDNSYGVVKGSPKLIIDAGGHIGAATLFLASKFPGAQIVTIEPDDENFALLEKNTGHLPNVKRLKAGLWFNNSTLQIKNPDDSPWAYNLKEGDGGIVGVTIPDILKMVGRDRVDVLKIDIEGAEVEVLDASGDWIGRVGMLMVELHDRFRAGCEDSLKRAVDGRGFKESRSGEYVVMTAA